MNELIDANVLVSPALTPRKKLTKFLSFGRLEHRRNQTTLLGLLCYKHSWLSLSALEKVILDSYKAK